MKRLEWPRCRKKDFYHWLKNWRQLKVWFNSEINFKSLTNHEVDRIWWKSKYFYFFAIVNDLSLKKNASHGKYVIDFTYCVIRLWRHFRTFPLPSLCHVEDFSVMQESLGAFKPFLQLFGLFIRLLENVWFSVSALQRRCNLWFLCESYRQQWRQRSTDFRPMPKESTPREEEA